LEVKRAIVLADCHFPFVNRKAYNLALDVADDINPDEILLLGDFADFYGMNSYGKDPEIEIILNDEIVCVKNELNLLRARFHKAKIVYIIGNHEHRLARYINNNCPELSGILSVGSLLQLDKINIAEVPYGPSQKYNVIDSQLIARHEPIGGGIHCAYQTVVKAGASVMFGHHHRIAEYQICNMKGEYLRGVSVGWLGDKDHSVMSYVPSFHNWQLGFAIVTVWKNTFFAQNIPIIDGKCLVDGTIYSD
jgi:hypothetical protein